MIGPKHKVAKEEGHYQDQQPCLCTEPQLHYSVCVCVGVCGCAKGKRKKGKKAKMADWAKI